MRVFCAVLAVGSGQRGWVVRAGLVGVRSVCCCMCMLGLWPCLLACRSVLPAALVLLLLYFAMTWATRGPGDVIEPGNLAGLPSAPGSSWGFTCWWGRGGDAPLALLLLFECNMMLTCIMASIYLQGKWRELAREGKRVAPSVSADREASQALQR